MINLRVTPNGLVLALALSDNASAKRTSGSLLGIGAIDRLSNHNNIRYEKTTTTRGHGRMISTSISEQVVTTRNRFDYPDVGILQGKTPHQRFGIVTMSAGEAQRHVEAGATLRFLQAKDYPLCGTNGTCAPSMCDAIGSRLTTQSAAVEFNAVCNGYTDENGKNWTFEGCVNEYYKNIPGHVEYVKGIYCQIARCSIKGGRYGECYCQLYHDACLTHGDERPVGSYSQPGNCQIDACCQNKTDEAGMLSCLDGYPSRNKYRQENPRCGKNGTCHPSFCDSYVGSEGMVYRAIHVNSICIGITDANGKKWGIEGCIRDYPGYPDYQLYYTTYDCELAKCFVDGGTEVSCYCQVFHTLCDIFGKGQKYGFDPCTIDACCQSKSTVAAKVKCLEMPDSSTMASPPSSSPEKVQNSSSTGAGDIPDATTEETPANNPPSSSAQSAIPSSSAGAMLSLVAAAAVSSILGCDAT